MGKINLPKFESRCVWCQRSSEPLLNSLPEQVKKRIRMILQLGSLGFCLAGSLRSYQIL